MLEKNIAEIRSNISDACLQANRSPESVTLISVTKSVEADLAAEIVNIGIKHLAENRVDKLLAKQAALNDETIKWHLIGNLQRRKVKQIINQIDYFHALDSMRLAEEIQKRAEHTIKCFVEVNVSEEATKHGIKLSDVVPFINTLAGFDKIQIVGLMTMAPFEANEQEIRGYFRQLKQKQEEIAQLGLTYAPCSELSMGMSQDYELAILEGATFVRVGRACFK